MEEIATRESLVKCQIRKAIFRYIFKSENRAFQRYHS